jgi:hypothetical protein
VLVEKLKQTGFRHVAIPLLFQHYHGYDVAFGLKANVFELPCAAPGAKEHDCESCLGRTKTPED